MLKIFIIVLFYINICNAQKKENVYFLYNSDISKLKKNETILIEEQTFRINNSIKKNTIVLLKNYNNKIVSLKEFYKKNKIKNLYDLIKDDFFIVVPLNKKYGKIIAIDFSIVINEPIE